MPKFEGFDGSIWVTLGGGTVTSVGINGSTGLGVTGSPITSSGTINLTLGSELQALSAFASTGLMARTGSNSYVGRTLTVGSNLTISNANGVLGNPLINLASTLNVTSLIASGNITSTGGNVSATSGTLLGNNLAAYNSTAVQVLNPLNMQSNDITGLPNNPVTSSSAISKTYFDLYTDSYQTLTYSSNINWNASNGNIAVLTLTGNCLISSINWNQESTLTLFVKQDSTGGRTLNIYSIYRAGSTSSLMPLSSGANAVDCLIFKWSGESGRLYLAQVINNFQFVPAPVFKTIFNHTGSIQSITIPTSATNVCRLKILGAGGGQGVYSSNGGNSGAGGYLIFQFDTSSYIGQSLFINVGQGGEGGVCSASGRAGYGGYPNGGGGSSWGTGLSGEYCGGGGGRSEVRIGSSSGTIVAIAGGGGGGSGYSSLHGGAGGSNNGSGQDTINGSISTGGKSSAGGTSGSSPPPGFNQSGFRQGAGFLTPQQYDAYTGGGGDGYYGGGFYAGYGSGGGGSSYINYGLPYSTILPDVSPSSGTNISSTASSDNDFLGGYGAGHIGTVNGTTFNALRGGNGRVVVEFI